MSENNDGISVFSFSDPVMAFEHFTENKKNYALVISDLRMPGLNGLELLKKVQTSNPNVRTILMSAYNFEEDILFLKYMEEGIIDSTIDKPTKPVTMKDYTKEYEMNCRLINEQQVNKWLCPNSYILNHQF